MRNPKAGPAAYLLLRGEGKLEDATSPAGSASLHGVSVLHSRENLVDEPTDAVLEKALELGTKIVALSIDDRERILRALDDPQTTPLVELRGLLLREHEWRVREGLV